MADPAVRVVLAGTAVVEATVVYAEYVADPAVRVLLAGTAVVEATVVY